MLLLFIGPSCSGKSSTADEIRKATGASVFAGRDYLRLAKSETEARATFKIRLVEAAGHSQLSEDSIIYVIGDARIAAELQLQNIAGARWVKFTASTETLKTRFAARAGGHTPPGIEQMLERQRTQFEPPGTGLSFDTTAGREPAEIAREIAFWCQG